MNSLIQYNKFPPSRYMGSKNKIIKNLYEVFNNYKFESALDLFSGSAAVSYLLKSMGKKVISNDYMSFASNISKAIIANNNTKLTNKDLNKLFKRPKSYNKFVQNKFNEIFFLKDDNDFGGTYFDLKIIEEYFNKFEFQCKIVSKDNAKSQ